MSKIGLIWDYCSGYVYKYRRYFAAGLVGAAMVGMLAVGTSVHVNPLAGAYSAYDDQSENKELKKLLNAYYKAFDNNDVEGLKKVADPFTDRELSYIAMMSEYIDSHQIEELYTKQGADENSLIVSAKVAIKYNSLDEKAPALDFFYLEKKGNDYKINNAYSIYNLTNQDLKVDDTITSLLAQFSTASRIVVVKNAL